MEEDIRNFKFNLTLGLQSLIIEMLINKQMIEEGKVEAENIINY